MLCRVMRVSQSGYYLWRKRLTKAPSRRRQSLASLVRNCYFENRRRYGTMRIKASLQKSGIEVGRAVIGRVMREQGLKAIGPKSFKPKTTDSKGTKASPNLLAAVKPKDCVMAKVIVGDITYVRLRNGGWCYLAVWQDKVTRRLIGWSLSETMTAELVISALRKAIRKGLLKAGAIIHSDQGSQYASTAFRELLRINCLRQSMSGKGNCYDNAQAESFFSRFKTELLEGGVFESIEQARSEIFSDIEGDYNPCQITFRFRLQKPAGIRVGIEN